MSGQSRDPVQQTQTAEPPAYLQPYLAEAAGQAQNIYKSGGPNYYPGQTVAPFNSAQNQGLNSITNLASQGGNLTPAANQQLLSTINGTNGVNPFLAGAVQSATAPIYDQFKNDTIPQLQSIFARTGGTGGSAEGFGAERAATALGRGLAETAGTLAYNSATQERQNQLNAVALAPQLDAARYNDASQLLNVGNIQQTQSQNEIQAAMDKYNYEQNLPALRLNQYIQQLQGSSQGGITTGYAPVGGAGVNRTGAVIGGILGGLGGAATGNPMAAIGGVSAGAGIGGYF